LRALLASVLALAAFAVFASSASAALTGVSDPDPGTHFPTYYKDSQGLALQLCLEGAPNCLAGADLMDIHAAGGDAEAFYYAADADVGPITVHNALEAAYAADGPDQEAVFMRTQISAQDGGLRANTRYTVTDPYGVLTCTSDGAGEIRNNSCRTETTVVPLEFQRALPGRIGPFLTWDTYGQTGAGAPPPGFIGDNATPHKVVGSPNNFNKVRVQGTGITASMGNPCLDDAGQTIANCAETDLFIVQGQVQPSVSASVTPGAVDFGDVVPTPAPVKTVTYTSTGDVDASVSGVALAGTDASDFAIQSETCSTAAAPLTRGATCSIDVRFTPRAGFSSSATLNITDNTGLDGAAATRKINLSGSSLPNMTVSPTTLAFGNQSVNSPSAEDNAVVGNTGVAPLTVASATLTGASASHFKISTNGCTTPVAPDGGCEIGVIFAPTTTGSKTANLRITDAAGNIANVALTGTGVTAPVTVPGAPTIGTATGGDAQATVNWSPPASNGGSAITSYTVQAFAGTSTTPAVTRTLVPATDTSFVVTGLTNGTSYTFRVLAVNSVGSSAASAASNAVTPATVPGAPTIGAPTAGDASATVRWTAPTNTGGAAISGYSVRTFSGTTLVKTDAVPVGTSAVISGLTNGTAYTFDVAATNSAGTGTFSGRSTAVTPTAGTTATAGITVRSSSSANNSASVAGGATTLAVPKPAGAVAGDVLVVTVAARGNPTVTPPTTTGWTLVRRDPAAGTVLAQFVYTHVVTATDGTSYSFGTRSSAGAAINAAGGAIAFTGVSATAPVNVHAGLTGAAASTSAVAPSVTPTRANTMLVALYATAAAPTSTTATSAFTPPTGMTERYDAFTPTTASFKISVESATALQATAAATGTRTATGPNGAPVGQLIALNPA
jgi:hypothetical protein